MRKSLILFLFPLALAATSCTTSTKTLYYWGDYTEASYDYYKKQTPEDTEDLLGSFEKMMARVDKGSRKMMPPGMCAEYGFLLIQNGKKEEGLALLKKETEMYPQSKKFVERIIKLVEK